MRHRIIPIAALLLFAPLGWTQSDGASAADKRRIFQTLQLQQKDAVARLDQLLDSAAILVKDLRLRGQDKKAELLSKAVAILRNEDIELSTVSGAGREGDRLLGDLKSAMERMHRLLNEETDRGEEVQELGKHVIETLARVIETLGKADSLESLDKRVKDLGDLKRDVRGLLRDQDELRKKTRAAVERSKAEKAAEKAVRDLESLQAMLWDIDQRSRDDLKELEDNRELAARLKDMLEQQQRLHKETKKRTGDANAQADEFTPRINRALAELEAIARAARDAERRADENQATAQMAAHLDRVAKQQEALAKRLEARDGAGKPDSDKFRETAADEQRVVRLAIQGAERDAPEEARPHLRAANTAAKDTEKNLREGKNAATSARRAATAARKAADVVKEAVAKQEADANKSAAKQQQNADRARKLANELDALATNAEAKAAGLSAELKKAKAAVERIADELGKSAKAEGEQRSRRAGAEARSAARRAEQTQQDLRDKTLARGDLTDRQQKVAHELRNLAERDPMPDTKQAADAADKARQNLAEGKHAEAAGQQKRAIAALKKALANAEKRADDAAGRNAGSLKHVQDATRKAAAKAGQLGKELEQGAQHAKENDSRRRLQDATDRVRQAEREIRNSLKKLRDAQPRAAEQDRREARDKLDGALRDLKGLREQHDVRDDATKQELKDIAKEQRKLEQRVRKLNEQLKKQKEQRGRPQAQDAGSAMRDAARRLEEADSDEAERAQERAQKSLEQARKELNDEQRQYRNLRQYELLFKLREELRNFRRESQTHRETLQKVAAMVKKAGRVTRHINRSEVKKLRRKLATLQRDVAEKADAIEKENAVVYSYLLKGCASDLKEVEALLADKDVGIVPRELLGDVVGKFELALRGLDREIQERKKEDQQGGQQQGQQQGGGQGNGQRPLVPPDAEIRMILVMQRTLNEERKNFFENRPELDERELSGREKSRLKRFYHKQGSLAELFDTLRQNLLGDSSSDMETPQPEGEDE